MVQEFLTVSLDFTPSIEISQSRALDLDTDMPQL